MYKGFIFSKKFNTALLAILPVLLSGAPFWNIYINYALLVNDNVKMYYKISYSNLHIMKI